MSPRLPRVVLSAGGPPARLALIPLQQGWDLQRSHLAVSYAKSERSHFQPHVSRYSQYRMSCPRLPCVSGGVAPPGCPTGRLVFRQADPGVAAAPGVRRIRVTAEPAVLRSRAATLAADGYTARHLSVLEGLEAVRKRPGMYIGSTDGRGLMHCLWEIIDNGV